MFSISLRMRNATMAAIYQKALRVSNSSRKESTIGEIVNLMSIDSQRFMDVTPYLNLLWSAPLQMALCLYFLWGYLGPSIFAGLGVTILFMPMNFLLIKKLKSLQIMQMKTKDERVKFTNEVLGGIKVLKFYAWEPSFENKLLQLRNTEVKILRKMAYYRVGVNFGWNCAPFLVSFQMYSDDHSPY